MTKLNAETTAEQDRRSCLSIAVPTKLQPSTVPPVVNLRIDQERGLLALEARGCAALVLAMAFGAGLLAWALVLVVKVVK